MHLSIILAEFSLDLVVQKLEKLNPVIEVYSVQANWGYIVFQRMSALTHLKFCIYCREFKNVIKNITDYKLNSINSRST